MTSQTIFLCSSSKVLKSENLDLARQALSKMSDDIKNILSDSSCTNSTSYKIVSVRSSLVQAYSNVFYFNILNALSQKDNVILNILETRIRSGVDIIKAKLEIDPNLINLDYNEFMLKITDADVEHRVVSNIRTWSPEMAILYDTYIIQETKMEQYQYVMSIK